jgi:hypothetical protein
MKSVAAALLHLLQLLRLWLLIIIVVALSEEISFTPRKIGSAEVLDLTVAPTTVVHGRGLTPVV